MGVMVGLSGILEEKASKLLFDPFLNLLKTADFLDPHWKPHYNLLDAT